VPRGADAVAVVIKDFSYFRTRIASLVGRAPKRVVLRTDAVAIVVENLIAGALGGAHLLGVAYVLTVRATTAAGIYSDYNNTALV
jgi:hypothetical protein